MLVIMFFFNDTAPTEIYTLSLNDALPICDALLAAELAQVRLADVEHHRHVRARDLAEPADVADPARSHLEQEVDRKSTRLNSSHANISYAVFCLKKKKKKAHEQQQDEIKT